MGSSKVAISAVIGALVTYIVSNELLDALVTGTSTGDTLITSVAPIVLAVVVVLVILRQMD